MHFQMRPRNETGGWFPVFIVTCQHHLSNCVSWTSLKPVWLMVSVMSKRKQRNICYFSFMINVALHFRMYILLTICQLSVHVYRYSLFSCLDLCYHI